MSLNESAKCIYSSESKKSVEGDHDAAMKTIQQLEEKVSLLEKEKEMLSKKYESLMNERTNEQRQNVEV
jgi:uncharacterized protein YoxC